MPRFAAAAGVIACLLLVTAPAVRAADPPSADEFARAAVDAGLACKEVGEPYKVKCTDRGDGRVWNAYVGDAFNPLSMIVDRAGPRGPAEADVLGLMQTYITLAVGEDAGPALAWLDGMNDGPEPFGDFAVGDWLMRWTYNESAEVDSSGVSMQVWYTGTGEPTRAEPSAEPSPAPVSPAPTATGTATTEPSAAAGALVTTDPPPPTGSGSVRSFAAAIPGIADISTDPMVVLQSALLAALVVFLMPFPSQLFNSTLEKHEGEVRRWFRLDRVSGAAGRAGAFWSSWPGIAAFTLLAAALYGFLDPAFGPDFGSLATFLGMLAGIILITVVFAIPIVLVHRRNGDRPSLKVVPISLLIGLGCVVISRLTSFQPGYLYGLLLGLVFARELSGADEGRATARGAALMLLVAFAAWLALGALPDGDDFALVVVRTSLAALMVAGLEGVVFGLLPMRFLPGESLYAWNRVLWGGLLAIGAFAFFHILINPASGYLSDTSRTPLVTIVALLVGFSVVSIAFWGWFRFRPVADDAVADLP